LYIFFTIGNLIANGAEKLVLVTRFRALSYICFGNWEPKKVVIGAEKLVLVTMALEVPLHTFKTARSIFCVFEKKTTFLTSISTISNEVALKF
jgi:hypothetical protein